MINNIKNLILKILPRMISNKDLDEIMFNEYSRGAIVALMSLMNEISAYDDITVDEIKLSCARTIKMLEVPKNVK